MLEFDGIAVKYPVNRKLTQEECDRQVEVKIPCNHPPADCGRVIASSSRHLELADKYFVGAGIGTALFLPPTIFFVWLAFFGGPEAVSVGLQRTSQGKLVFAWVAIFFSALCVLAINLMCLWAITRESFTLTHYPIRFNRKNRMVYVFRPKRRASILRVKWDDVFWHIRHNKNRGPGGYNWFVAGHVMEKDRKTVKETFAFGHVGSTPEELYPQWEYVRRFMEDGQDAVPAPEYYLPINGRKEGFWQGAQTLMLRPFGPVIGVFLMPLTAPGAIARWLCMLTNRVPRWPADIDADCGIGQEPLREPVTQAKPQYPLLTVMLLVGIALDVALLVWLFAQHPVIKKQLGPCADQLFQCLRQAL